jgi:phosphonoacetaldehyde hydrolase
MLFRVMEALDVYPPWAVVKVGDTPVDVAEGRNAGAWSVGVIDSGNEIGLSEEEFDALPAPERERRRRAVRETFLRVGAHAAIDSLHQLAAAIKAIEERLKRGERS